MCPNSFTARTSKEGRLHFASDLADAVTKTDIVFLALLTPSREEGSDDISSVLVVSSNQAKLFSEEKKSDNFRYKIVVNKSTIPVGTLEIIKQIFEESSLVVGEDFDVASNQEFLCEAYAAENFILHDKLVIGVSSAKAEKILKEIYTPFIRSGNPRRGEGEPAVPWDQSWLAFTVEESYSEPFPTGILEREVSIGLEFLYEPSLDLNYSVKV